MKSHQAMHMLCRLRELAAPDMAASKMMTGLVAILVTSTAQAADLRTMTMARMFVSGVLAISTMQPSLLPQV